MGADLVVVPFLAARQMQGFRMEAVTVGTIIRVEPLPFRLNASVINAIGNIPGVAGTSPQLYVTTRAIPDLSPNPVAVYGIDPVTDFTVQPWLAEPLKNPLGQGEIIAGSALGGNAGSAVSIGDRSYRIAGRLAPTRSDVDMTVFMTMDDAYALAAAPGTADPSAPSAGRDEVTAILVRTARDADTAMVGSRIQQPFPSTYLSVLQKHVTLRPASQDFRSLPRLLNLISLILILTALPLIALITAMSVHERQREIGLLGAMGAGRRFVFSMVFSESLTLAAAGGIAGSLAAAILLVQGGEIFPSSFLHGFAVPPAGQILVMAGEAVLIVIVIGSLASFLPAYRSSRMSPYDAIRSTD
jgi:putative ABC transport system permease protein